MDAFRWSNLLAFEVAGEACAIPAEAVAQVVPMAALARSPGLPPVVAGFLNLGGSAVPVIRVDRLFNAPSKAPGLYAHMIVLRERAGLFALLVDRVLNLAPIPSEAARPLPEGATFNGCAVAEVEWNGRTAHVLSPERLLLEREEQSIAAFREMAQRYIDELEAAAG